MPVAQLANAIVADQAAGFTFTITWLLEDGTPAFDSSWSATWEWPSSDLTPLAGDQIVLGDDGTVTVSVGHTVTGAWSFGLQRFRLFLTQPGQEPLVLLDGKIQLDKA